MGLYQDQMGGHSTPTFGLSDTDYSQLPKPHDTGLFRLVIPTQGLDTGFIWKVSQLMEISFDRNDPIEMSALTFVVQESLRQIFTNFDRSPAVYLTMLNGSLTDPNIPGLPTRLYFNHIQSLLPEDKWNEFKNIFRYYAMEFYAEVLGWANLPQYSGLTFTFHDFPISGGSLGFIISKERNHYVIG